MRRASNLLIVSAVFLGLLAAASFAEPLTSTNFVSESDIVAIQTQCDINSSSFNSCVSGSIIGDVVSSTNFENTYGVLPGATEVTVTSTTTTTVAAGTSGVVSFSTSSDNKVSGISVDPGANVTIKAFTNVSLTAINIIANRTISNAGIAAKKIEESALTVPKPAEKAYQFIQVDKTNILDVALRTVKIKFSVTKSWLAENNVAETQVALQRYDNGGWTKLPTRKLSIDDTKIDFESDSPGLSVFAITALALGETPPSTIPEISTTTTTSATLETTTTTTPEGKATDSTGLIAAVILIAIIIGAVFLRKK